jgi:hypothetical protein
VYFGGEGGLGGGGLVWGGGDLGGGSMGGSLIDRKAPSEWQGTFLKGIGAVESV